MAWLLDLRVQPIRSKKSIVSHAAHEYSPTSEIMPGGTSDAPSPPGRTSAFSQVIAASLY